MTGLRLGDLVRLDWGSVGEKAIVLKTKKRGGRAVIPIFPSLRKALDQLGPDKAKRAGPVLRNSMGKAWTKSGQNHKNPNV